MQACTGRSDPLAAFLAARRLFRWGEYDCLTWLGVWVAVKHGFDPASPWHGRYRTRLGAMQIVRRAGGMPALLDGALEPFGVGRADEPSRGDIAVVAASEGEMGAIVLGSNWLAMNSEHGIVRRTVTLAPILAAWKI